MRTFKNMDYL